MRLAINMTRRRRISLTSLIDVIFLLLLFFMLSSTFSRFNAFELNAAGGSLSKPEPQLPILLRLKGSELTINGQSIDQPQFAHKLSELVARKQTKAVLVILGDTTTQQMVSWLEILETIPSLSVTLVRQ